MKRRELEEAITAFLDSHELAPLRSVGFVCVAGTAGGFLEQVGYY